MMASDTSYWIKFFTDCSIPAGEATNYAIIFTDNRIQKDMLIDLNKEYLKEMGITVLGDVIAILKHAKNVHSQMIREKALKGTVGSRTASPVPRRSTAASRTVNHYLGKDPDAVPMNQPNAPKLSKQLAERLGESPVPPQTDDSKTTPTGKMIKLNNKKLDEVVPVPKSRRVFPEHEGRYKIKMPSGTTTKTQKILLQQQQAKESYEFKKSLSASSVFDRLGADSNQPRLTRVGSAGDLKIKSSSPASVFNRLGNKCALKRAATSTSPDLDSDDEEGPPLEYAGILKPTLSPVKKTKFTVTNKKGAQALGKITITNKNASSLGKVTVSNSQPVTSSVKSKKVSSGIETAGILAGREEEPKSVRARLGKKISQQVVSSTTNEAGQPKISKTVGVRGRLGAQKTEVSSSTSVVNLKKKITQGGVFGRLGKHTGS